MELDNLTDELKAQVLACKSTDELVALTSEEGIELTDEQLEGLAGGVSCCGDYDC